MVCFFLWEEVMKGKEYGVSFPTTMEWVSRGLRKYVNQDRFGIYKKENVKIPFIYKHEYNSNKKNRELMINRYYNNSDKEQILKVCSFYARGGFLWIWV